MKNFLKQVYKDKKKNLLTNFFKSFFRDRLYIKDINSICGNNKRFKIDDLIVKFNKVKLILKDEIDRQLYDFLTSQRLYPEKSRYYKMKCDFLLRYLRILYESPMGFDLWPCQYLDYINKDKIKTVINGGAWDGFTTLQFVKEFKNIEKIYAFEIFDKYVRKSSLYEEFSRNKKIEYVNKALSSKEEEMFLYEHKILEGGYVSKVRQEPCNKSYYCFKGMIKSVSIDQFVEENNIEKIDFIKLDIEGAEYSAVQGAINTLQNHRPQIAVSIYHNLEDMYEIPLFLNETLKNYVFKIMHYDYDSLSETILYAIPDELYTPPFNLP